MSIDNEIDTLNEELDDLVKRMVAIQTRLAGLSQRNQPVLNGPRLLSVTQAAKIAGVSRATMYRMVDDGTAQVVTAGSTMKIPAVWVEKYINGDVAQISKETR